MVNADLAGRHAHNVKVSVMNATTKINAQDMLGYYTAIQGIVACKL